MRKFLSIWGRELASAFLSPVAYVTMVAYLVIANATFVTGVIRNAGTAETLSSLLYAALVLWQTVLVTVIAMRLFAEEKRSGTLETLITAPVTETQVIMGKYAGALTFVVAATLPAVAAVFVLAGLGPGWNALDPGAVAGGGLILLLLSALAVAVGLLVSLLTRNQIVAAICCFTAIWGVLLLGWILTGLPFGLERFGESFSALSHVEEFSRGAIDTRPIVLYVSATALTLFVSVRILESERWR